MGFLTILGRENADEAALAAREPHFISVLSRAPCRTLVVGG